MTDGRVNQKARTRDAIVGAAVELLREHRAVTIPAAADAARVSQATAYRYFSSAEDLAQEAGLELLDVVSTLDAVAERIHAAGDDVYDRLEAVIRSLGWTMLTEQLPFRQAAKTALDRWFEQQQDVSQDPMPVRTGRRDKLTRRVLEPVKSLLTKADHERLVAALNVGWGTEAMISLIDIDQLAPDEALEVMLVTCRWILAGALADAGVGSAAVASTERPR